MDKLRALIDRGVIVVNVTQCYKGSDRASICLFLRRDLEPLEGGVALRVTDEAIAGSTNLNRAVMVRARKIGRAHV